MKWLKSLFNKRQPQEQISEDVKQLNQKIIKVVSLIYLGRLYRDNWGEEFAWKETNRWLEQLEKEVTKFNFKDLNDSERAFLGFDKWNVSTRFVPAYAYEALKSGAITGKPETVDSDTRNGMIWFEIPSTTPR